MTQVEAEERLAAVKWDSAVIGVMRRIVVAGGRPYLVGGAVRDALLGNAAPKDLDVEVHGLLPDDLMAVLRGCGEVDEVGASFGVAKLSHVGADFSLPRRDSKNAPGHKGFDVTVDPHMGIDAAARRRDLTINSLTYDPFAGRLYDAFGGLRDLADGVLAPTDPLRFLDDPLRALRAAQFVSRLGFRPSPELATLCSEAQLAELPGERIFEEFRKLLSGRRPDLGLEFMRETEMIEDFPELASLIACPQDKEWHPEGDVWVHTCMAVREARALYEGEPDMVVMWATLCHDLGKPSTTRHERGRIRSLAHEQEGVWPSKSLLERLRAPNALISAVCALVARHLAPAMFAGEKGQAGPGAYRRLALKLADAGTSIEALERVSRADHFGRTTPEALAKQFPAGDEFLKKATNLGVRQRPEEDVVLGRHLIEAGLQPGPEFGALLRRCRDIQFETGVREAVEVMRLAGITGVKP